MANAGIQKTRGKEKTGAGDPNKTCGAQKHVVSGKQKPGFWDQQHGGMASWSRRIWGEKAVGFQRALQYSTPTPGREIPKPEGDRRASSKKGRKRERGR